MSEAEKILLQYFKNNSTPDYQWILLAMKEIAEKAFEAGETYQSQLRHIDPIVAPDKETYITNLFKEI